MYFVKNSALVFFINLSVIAAILFITVKQNAILRQSSWTYGNLTSKHVKMSAISEHFLTCDCDINFDDFIVWPENSNSLNLFIKESSLVTRGSVILNKTVKSFPLELSEWKVFHYNTTFFTVLLIKKQRNISNILIMTRLGKQREGMEVLYRRSNNSTKLDKTSMTWQL